MKKNLHDNAPSPLSAVAQASRLVRRKASPMALEQRFMFDGAAVVEAAAVLEPVVQEVPAPDPVAEAEAQTAEATADTTEASEAAAGEDSGGESDTSAEQASSGSLFVHDTDMSTAAGSKLQGGLEQAQQTLQTWAASPDATADVAQICSEIAK